LFPEKVDLDGARRVSEKHSNKLQFEEEKKGVGRRKTEAPVKSSEVKKRLEKILKNKMEEAQKSHRSDF
jgi:hypothetical protein